MNVNSKMVTNVTMFTIVLTLFSSIGWGIYQTIIGSFNFPAVPETVVNTVNYVFDLIFGSVSLLGFFVRPSTLVFAVHCVCYYYMITLSLKFSKMCINLASKTYDIIKGLSDKLNDILLGLLGKFF